ncbi:MAG: activator 1 38 kDa subunit [Piptocephalis tieghemiana]|nr:MAG: activator 1 38 kDa subunit [Piptocephalis tieghemiana]
MSLWVDQYRPKRLDDLSYHQGLTDQLASLASSGDIPHLLVYGPSGAGKKTRIHALLHDIYGPGVEKVKMDIRAFTTPSNRKLEIPVISSNYHIELTPSDVGIHDRVVVQELIKEIAQTHQMDVSAKRRFKVVIIHEADMLTKDAQAALRRTMEKYTSTLRMVLVCNTTGRLLSPIRSRCLLVRVALPTSDEVFTVLQHVSTQEGFTLPEALGKKIAEKSDRNLRKAILMLEATKATFLEVTEDQDPPEADWEVFIQRIAQMILQEQTPARLLQVREKLYELITHCIAPTVILKELAFHLTTRVDSQIKADIIRQAAFYEHRMHRGQKAIFHLEAFVAKIMSHYKR